MKELYSNKKPLFREAVFQNRILNVLQQDLDIRFLSDWIGYFFRIGYIKTTLRMYLLKEQVHSIFIVGLRIFLM